MAEYAKLLRGAEGPLHAAKAALAQVMAGIPMVKGLLLLLLRLSCWPAFSFPLLLCALAQAEVPADMKNLPANGGSQKPLFRCIKSETAVEVRSCQGQKDFDEKSAD